MLVQVSGRPILAAGDRERLRARAVEGVRRARRAGECLVAITVALDAAADPTAIAVASRRAGEDWFCFEHPDRDRFALATLGRAAAIDDRGKGRFERVAARWRALVAGAVCDDGRPVAVGGFAFAPEGGAAPHWAGFSPASLHVPEVAIARRGDEVTLTFAAVAAPDDDPDGLVARLEERAAT